MSELGGEEGNAPDPKDSNDPKDGEGTPGAPKDDAHWFVKMGGDESYIKDNESLGQIKTLNDLAKGYVHAQQLVGKDKVVLPTKNSSVEEWDDFYARLGLPPEDKYEVKPLENASDADREFMKTWAKTARKHRVMPEAAQELYQQWEKFQDTQDEKYGHTTTEEMKKDLRALHDEWGEAYDSRLNRAQRAAKTFGGDEFMQHLNESGLGNNINLIRVFDRVGAKIFKEDTPPPRGTAIGGIKGTYKTPAEAQSEYNRIIMDPKHPYTNANHADHENAVKMVTELMKLAYPTD